MKLVSCSIAVLTLLAILGCKTAEERAFLAASHTDYVIGKTYRLKKPVFLFKYDRSDAKEIPTLAKLGFAATPSDLETFRQKALTDHQVAGLLVPGDQIKVIRFEKEYSLTIGRVLHVLAVIVSGESTNQIVDLSMISRDGDPSRNGYEQYIDPAYLESL